MVSHSDPLEHCYSRRLHWLILLVVIAIDLSGWRYNWLGTIFYIAYICSQWLLIGWKHFKPHVWCGAVVLLWGFIASIQAAITSWSGLMACRFFLVQSSSFPTTNFIS
jgi:hypothetical protein